MSRRTEMLELAILGLLHDSPMHGYELRKRLHLVMGTVRALSYGTLYPRLKEMVRRGWITEVEDRTLLRRPSTGLPTGRRARITYELTADGKERFGELLEQAGPAAWEDGTFDVHFAFFGRTNSEVRLSILEGRRSRLEERLAAFRSSAGPRRDEYTAELHRHGLESAEREVRWLAGLIESERHQPHRPGRTTVQHDAPTDHKE
jgi:DNA-binding PadR family transcriptional regulator